jgi:2-polyprenyl-3-methyl-5-hydroxy-6-metoxy-1,4-benzoquinol methylase
MSVMARLRHRCLQPEVMDQPDLDHDEHLRALRGLERINWWTDSAGILWGPIRRLARGAGPPLRVLDLATGAGDVPLRLWKRAVRRGLALEVAGCDLSPRAIDYARGSAQHQGAPVSFFPLDALTAPLPTDFDVLCCSFFLHHLSEDQAIDLLRRMAAAARRLVLIHDLVRGLPGFLLAVVGTRLLSRSRVVHNDGRKSVEGAFTPAEVRDLALRAGLGGVRVTEQFPFRLLVSWEPPEARVGPLR